MLYFHVFLILVSYLISGVFLNCVFIPTAIHVTHFFDKYQSLALMAITCFVPLMFSILPPCITHLVEQFDWRDANLFIAMICVQVRKC